MEIVTSRFQLVDEGGDLKHLIVFVGDTRSFTWRVPKEVATTATRFGSLLTFTYPNDPVDDQQELVKEICDEVEFWLTNGGVRLTFVGSLLTYNIMVELNRRGMAPDLMDLILFNAFNGDQADSFRRDPRLRDPGRRDEMFIGKGVISINLDGPIDPEDHVSALWAAATGCCLNTLNVRGGMLEEDPRSWARRLDTALVRLLPFPS